MAKSTRSSESRKSPVSKSRPFKKAAGSRRVAQPIEAMQPGPLPVQSHVALATTFPIAGDVEISQMEHVGHRASVMTERHGRISAFLHRLVEKGLGKR